jgi:NitT/TauT family transport system permease protein
MAVPEVPAPEIQLPEGMARQNAWTPALRAALLRAGTLVVVGVLLIGLWIALSGASTEAILPGPVAVWQRFLTALNDGTYFPALFTTAVEAAAGWGVGALVALPLGYAIGRVRVLEDALAPYLAGSQAMPVVAIAPLLVVWLGFGIAPKITVCALITFFPMLATTASGVRSVQRDLVDAARVFGANEIQLARNVFVPLSARTVFAGIEVAAALSVTGAVVGEFVNSNQGLGWLINVGQTNFDTPLMFVAVLSLIALGALAYTSVSMVERWTIRWED